MSDDGPRNLGPLGWSGQVRDELARLPETAANIREASENLRKVSVELVEVSALLAQIVRVMETTGMIEGLARAERLGKELEPLRRALAPPTSVDDVRDRVQQVEQLVAGLSDRLLRSAGLRRVDVDDEREPPG